MIKEIITITEHHGNGALFYQEKRGVIYPLFVDVYKNSSALMFNEGIHYIKLECTKYFDNGQLAWSLKWDENGNLLNKKDKTYRKDGAVIIT